MALFDILVGSTEEHLVRLDDGLLIHRSALPAWNALQARAKEAGIDLKIASGFRSHAAQLNIWNQKCTGGRPVLNSQGEPLAISSLSPLELVHSILRWSALPGASRHHWGTDIDVYDAKALPSGYRLQLTPQEAETGGVLHKFESWLSESISEFDFFRPYAKDQGGVSPEWWHLSFRPIAETYFENYDLNILQTRIENSNLNLKETVLNELPTLYTRYVKNITLD